MVILSCSKVTLAWLQFLNVAITLGFSFPNGHVYQNHIGSSSSSRRMEGIAGKITAYGRTRGFLRLSKCDTNNDDPLIPKELLFGNLEHRIPSLSPDGKFIAYVGPKYSDGSCCYVYVRPIDAPAESAQIVSPDNRIRNFFWAPDSRTILYYVNVGPPGSETYHLWRTNAVDVVESTLLEKADIQDLTPGEGVKAQNGVLSALTEYKEQLLIATNKRDSTLFDMYRCNIYTGACVLDTMNPGDVLSWGVDQSNFEVRQALVRNQNDSSTTIRIREHDGKGWKDLYTYPYGELGNFVGFSGDDKCCWITTSLGRDTKALKKINIETGKEVKHRGNESEALFCNDKCDIGEVFLDRSGIVTMTSYHYEKKELYFFDKELKHHFHILAKLGPVSSCDEIRIVSKTRDESVWLVSYEPSDAPNSYAIYWKEKEEMQPLFCSQPGLLQYVNFFSKMEAFSIISRDGLSLVSYLTKPRTHLEGQRSPLVVLVHGGPWERDYYGFNPLVQWLANRGYCVLQVNFRGSSGFGKSFMHKGDRQWGVGSMQHDLTDSVQWSIDVGIADEDNVCIFGASYGGYASLAGLCFTPELYKCGVAIAGPSNVKTLVASIPSYWKPLQETMLRRIGNVDEDDRLNRQISPCFHVENIIAPLLIGQGGNDPRVKQSETDKIAFAMKERNIDIEYNLYPDEGHNILAPFNRFHFFGRVESFLAKHLSGRYEKTRNLGSSVINPLQQSTIPIIPTVD